MKKQVIYIHGGDSFSEREDFLKYLKTTPLRDPLGEGSKRWPETLRPLLGEGYDVYMPTMPNKTNARYDEWSIWFERYLELTCDGVILIGWSLGGMFLAKYLSENKPKQKVAALFLLAAPSGRIRETVHGDDCESFRPEAGAVAKLGTFIPRIEIWHSTDDFVVPVSETEWYQAHIKEAEMNIFTDRNHFLTPELPELIKAVQSIE